MERVANDLKHIANAVGWRHARRNGGWGVTETDQQRELPIPRNEILNLRARFLQYFFTTVEVEENSSTYKLPTERNPTTGLVWTKFSRNYLLSVVFTVLSRKNLSVGDRTGSGVIRTAKRPTFTIIFFGSSTDCFGSGANHFRERTDWHQLLTHNVIGKQLNRLAIHGVWSHEIRCDLFDPQTHSQSDFCHS